MASRQDYNSRIPILLVDDRALDLEVIRDLIEINVGDDGIEVVSFNNGFDAIDVCKKREFGFIILDVKMPNIDGFETANSIRETEKNKSTPIIFLTSAFDDPEMFHKAYEIGAADFLPKPPTPQIMKNKLDLFISLARNRRSLQEAKLVIMESLNVKNNFLAVISHEIRTPLNLIYCVADLLESETDPKERMSFLEHLQSSTKYLLHLVENLLDLTKIDLANVSLERKSFDLVDLVERLINGHDSKLKKKNVQLQYEVAAALPRFVIGDPLRVHQVLANLISNAIKFTDQGYITVSLACFPVLFENRQIFSITVKDSGIGIPKEQLDAIFGEFVQVDMSSTRQYGGLGIGLALAKQLAELMGGSLTVKSEEGKGSEFYLTLELECVASLEMPIAPIEPTQAVSQKFASELKVLVVDDELVNRKVADIYLKKIGVTQSVHAENGLVGLERFKAERFDIVIMDLYMPLLDGVGCTKSIRDYEKQNNLPPALIIAATACLNIGEIEKLRASGSDSVLAKPLKKEALYKAMEPLMNRYSKKIA